MELMRNILIFSFLVSFNSFAFEFVKCSESDIEFILNKLNTSKLIKVNESNAQLTSKSHTMCNLNNPIILDGLAYSLYKSKNNELQYITVYNGLDGSSKTYGPFSCLIVFSLHTKSRPSQYRSHINIALGYASLKRFHVPICKWKKAGRARNGLEQRSSFKNN